MSEGKLLSTLRRFEAAKCQFILVGGLAAVLNGVPIQTYDVDLVYARSPENIERLLTVLAELDAVFRIQPERRLRPLASHLSGSGHLNLLTQDGPLDLLASIGRGWTYEDPIPHSSETQIGEGVHISVLNLDTLIKLKEELAGEKDLAMLPILRQTQRIKNTQRPHSSKPTPS